MSKRFIMYLPIAIGFTPTHAMSGGSVSMSDHERDVDYEHENGYH